jgi:hypothetical protein
MLEIESKLFRLALLKEMPGHYSTISKNPIAISSFLGLSGLFGQLPIKVYDFCKTE